MGDIHEIPKGYEDDGVDVEDYLYCRSFYFNDRSYFEKEGSPFYYEFKVNFGEDRESILGPTRTQNDIGLRGVGRGKHSRELLEKYKDFEEVSALREDDSYHEYVEKHISKQGRMEGGKGLTHHIYHSNSFVDSMSNISHIAIAYGCSASCAFCKESNWAGSETGMDIFVKTGVVRVKVEELSLDIEVPSKVKVKFYDPEVGFSIIGPLEVPLAYGLPIQKHSLLMLKDRGSWRLLDE